MKQRSCTINTAAAAGEAKLHPEWLSVDKAQEGWYSGLDSNDSSDLKLPCFQSAFSCSPHCKLLKAVLIFVKYCRIDSPLVGLKAWSIHTAQPKAN